MADQPRDAAPDTSPTQAGTSSLPRSALPLRFPVWTWRRTALGLTLEAILPHLLAPAAILVAFLVTAWLGLFGEIEPLWRAAVTGLFGLAFLASLRGLLGIRLPDEAAIRRRLDGSRPELHRPLATMGDRLAAKGDAFAEALWQVHQRRAEAASLALAAVPADARIRRRDPVALRAFAVLALVAAAFVAGEDRQARLAQAFDWTTPVIPPVPPRLDAWIDPPAYTGRPPIFLSATADEVIRAPLGSTITIRSTAPRVEGRENLPPAITVTHGPGLEPPKAEAPAEGAPAAPATPPRPNPGIVVEKRVLKADADLRVLRQGQEIARYQLAVIPDLPPGVALKEVRAESANVERQSPGGIRLAYEMTDDYGIAKAELVIERASAPFSRHPRTLFPAPAASLPLRLGAGEAALPTEDHPWAGEEVRVRIRVEDDVGQSAFSEWKTVMLPQRPFSQALPRALVEQRRLLNFSPMDLAPIRLAFDALLFEPEKFTPRVGDFIALDMIRTGLRTSRNEDRLRGIADQIYDFALYLENGDMTDAERRLREAEARLRDALERGATPEEIKRLAEELRRAMDQFLREFAERSLRDQDRNARDQSPVSPERLLTQRDLAEMLRKIEEMARSGNTAEAQRLLNELRQMMENLRSARRQDVDPRMRELGQQLEELDRLQREQRDLRDRTFREGQQQRGQRQQGQQGQRQQGQQGQQRGQRQPGQQGQEGGSLEEQQQALRDRLRQLRERLQQRGMQEGEGFGEAEEGMGDAQGQLGQGNPGDATEGQQRALDGLGRAAQGMAQELQRQLGQGNEPGEGEGEGPGFGQPGPGQRGRAENRMDPLGRPQANQRRDFEDNTTNPDIGRNDLQGSISERAERVLRELRRRLGEFDRPQGELDYLDRLLRQR
ncbi:TIGR02302 family protein [Rhabdaerophilum sp. SD176]|uniref:TIGR02302 family protein n=1 Tax=Rhabdaerophilum sp. SD176 TaxID=2983548 RepID=UPI0024DF5819|nr:TIGR02302 family protein [Rhabdaerophilum sp. SD176]